MMNFAGWCKSPAPGQPLWAQCTSPPKTVEQINLQLASPTSIVVSFVTFNDPDSTSNPPQVRYVTASADDDEAWRTAHGVTHVYKLARTHESAGGKQDPAGAKAYFLHFVRLSGLAERTEYSYSVRSGGSSWSAAANFTSLYSGGETRLALFGDMGVYAWNAMGNLLRDGVKKRQFDAIVHMGDHAYNYGDKNGTRNDAYLQGYSKILSHLPWVPVVGNHEGFDSFHLFFNETDGENSALDPAPSPHPMTSLLRTCVF